ncbi:MAG: hypothetical protein EBZ48_05490 [Proteobacteria bacterium]|nr:hypothetical protein [Pseudomonadota bacterium]
MSGNRTTQPTTPPARGAPQTVADDLILEVPMQEARMLLGSGRKKYLSTLGVATCTAVVISAPQLGAAMLFHEAPNLGPRIEEAVGRFLEKLKQGAPEFDPFRTEVHFHFEIGPMALAKMSPAQQAERIASLTAQVREYFPTADPLPLGQIRTRVDPSEKSVSLIFDSRAGTLARYSTWGAEINTPPQDDFERIALPRMSE